MAALFNNAMFTHTSHCVAEQPIEFSLYQPVPWGAGDGSEADESHVTPHCSIPSPPPPLIAHVLGKPARWLLPHPGTPEEAVTA